MDFPKNSQAYFLYRVSVDIKKPLFPLFYRGFNHIEALVGTNEPESKVSGLLEDHLLNIVSLNPNTKRILNEVRAGKAIYKVHDLTLYVDKENVRDIRFSKEKARPY